MPGSDLGSSSNQPTLDELISLTKAAEISGLTTSYLRRLIREKKLWGRKLGRNWVTTEKAVRGYLAQNRKPGPRKK
jgi:hypothetical protein